MYEQIAALRLEKRRKEKQKWVNVPFSSVMNSFNALGMKMTELSHISTAAGRVSAAKETAAKMSRLMCELSWVR